MPADAEHRFTDDDRKRQLETLARLCTQVADLLASHGEGWHADALGDRADEARRLLENGFTKEELNVVAGQFPDGPDWLHPKFADYNGPRADWQETVADLMDQAGRVALDLRAVATR